MTPDERMEHLRDVYLMACQELRARGLPGNSLYDLAAFITCAIAAVTGHERACVINHVMMVADGMRVVVPPAGDA